MFVGCRVSKRWASLFGGSYNKTGNMLVCIPGPPGYGNPQ